MRSDYTYEIEGKILAIIDLNRGRMSVTNNIENVCREISAKEKIDLRYYRIVYRDSEGRWDGFDWETQEFVHLDLDIEKLLS